MKHLVVFFAFLFIAENVAPAPNSRIVGGTIANAGEFPFAAGIKIHTSDGNYFCAGALISNEWLLTAAQCALSAWTFSITLGGITLSGTEPTRITVAAEHYEIHPNFNPDTLESDIGLIKFRLPITFTDYIQPIVLPREDIETYAIVVAIGWGQINDQSAGLVESLHRVTLTVLTNEECRITFGNQIADTMVCVEGNYNQGTCNGDSGGPLIQYVHGTAATVVGVSSFFSGNGCESTDPSGFTRVFPHIEWIRNTTSIVD